MSLDGKPLKWKQSVSFHANQRNFPSSNSFNLILLLKDLKWRKKLLQKRDKGFTPLVNSKEISCLGFGALVEETKVFPCEPDRGNIWEEVCGNYDKPLSAKGNLTSDEMINLSLIIKLLCYVSCSDACWHNLFIYFKYLLVYYHVCCCCFFFTEITAYVFYSEITV